MKDWKEWFEEKNEGRSPRPVDYVLAAVEGPDETFRDAAARAYARYFIRADGSIPPNVGEAVVPLITMNYSPGNAFFLEWEDKVDKYHLDRAIAYTRWRENSEPERAAYKAKVLQKKRVIALKNAARNYPQAVEEMKRLSRKWEMYRANGLLTQAVNISMASKFMDQIRLDPSMERFLPAGLVDNPGTKLSAPFYNEIRRFIKNEKEEYEGFLVIKGDYRKKHMNKLRTEADRDYMLRKNPEKAKQYGDLLKKKRMELEKARKSQQMEKGDIKQEMTNKKPIAKSDFER